MELMRTVKDGFLSTARSRWVRGLRLLPASRADLTSGRRPPRVRSAARIESHDIEEIGQRLEQALDDVAIELKNESS